MRFVYAISPGLDVTYHSKQDENALNEKFAQLISLGVLDFAVLFDDIENKTLKQEDQPHFTSLGLKKKKNERMKERRKKE